jgi:hypothetical protein
MYQSLWCPMLEGFIVEYDPEYEIDFDKAPEEFGAFIEGSPALLALSLSELPISGQEVITVLRLDVLLALQMQEQTDSDEILQALTPLPDHERPLLPQLRHICIDSPDITADMLSNFLEHRGESAALEQLESYHIEIANATVGIRMDVWTSVSMVLSLIDY